MREKLGEGGMGEVHLVLDRRIGREVALKVVHPEQARRPDLRARFLREARVQGQLEHPSIVPVYEMSVESEAPYFTMRRVRGVTLEQVIEAVVAGAKDASTRFSRRKLLTAFDNVCLAIDFAHARGVLHRDLKPSNIMLGDFGEVHVLDWGIAKVADAGEDPAEVAVDPGELTDKTEAGAFLGTLGFISPEQLRGESVTPRSDVYSLGAILFEILAHKALHEGTRTTDVVQSTLNGVDARPSARAPDGDVPPELDAICVKATALLPAERYASARELHDAIEGFLDGARDVEMRRDLARGHARRALEAAARATSAKAADPDGDRTVALKEAARSLALDPENTDAMEATLRLRAQPPRRFPREVQDQLAHIERGVLKRGAAFGAVAFLFVLVYTPFAYLMGIREPFFIVETAGLFLASAAVLFARARKARPSQIPLLVVFSMLALAMMTRIAGPFAIVPALLVANTVSFAMLPKRADRWLALAAGCASIIVPTILEWTGALGASYAFHDGAFTVLPHALSFPRTVTFAYFTMTSIGSIVVPFLFVSQLRAKLYETQRTIVREAWQIRQLVPEQVQEVAGTAPVATGGPRD
jgi:serine/threonine-protein kinase